MTIIQDSGSDETSQTKTKNQINQQQQNPQNQNKTSFYSFYQFCFTIEIYKMTKLESIVPSKEGAIGIQSQNLT